MSRRRQLLLLQCFGIHWLFCQADGFPLTRESRMAHPCNWDSPMKRRPFMATTRTTLFTRTATSPSSRTNTALASLSWRGGAAMASVIPSFTQRIVSSTKACWVVLILTVIVESCATSISKQSRDLKSKRLFGVACALYLLRYVGRMERL